MRGRGCLEIRPSSNPFYQSTASDIGVNPKAKIEWQVSGAPPPIAAPKKREDGTFAFLYTRESDVIGSKVPKVKNDRPSLMTTTEFLKTKREAQVASGNIIFEPEVIARTDEEKAAELLSFYVHNPKVEDPRYVTSAVSSGLM